jgi:hypothetical protein
MKRIVLFMSALALSVATQAQIKTPAPSPAAKVMQTVGLTDMTVEYSRPAMRDREIFGNLVPFGEVWRTGANANTTITFSEDVLVSGEKVSAGTYAIYTRPDKSEWEFMLYSDTNNWGVPQDWDDSKVIAKATAKVQEMPMDIESFTITFDDVMSDSVNLGFLWEDSYVALPIKAHTDKTVMSNIEATLNGPSAADYYAAAVYYSTNDKDIKKAQEWMTKAMGMMEQPAFWQLRQQSLIYAKAGNKKMAIETAKKSLAGAEKAGNADYIKMNNDSLKEWGAK